MQPSIRFILQRLDRQRLAGSRFESPAQIVGWLGAVQAQDYLGALWAVGLRLTAATEASVEQALAERSIVRTWPLRGTLHFAAAADVRWMLALLAPRMIAGAARRFKQLELDEAAFARSQDVLIREMQGGKMRSRPEIYQALESAQISTQGQRGIHILWRLAQEGLICFGARQGKQQTFALLDEWIPPSETMPREAALAELARRYFTGHGPATLQDFAWWSGLSAAEVRQALELVKPSLEEERIESRSYWLVPSALEHKEVEEEAVLLPGFDEYLVGYTDRSVVLDPKYSQQTNNGGGILNPTLLIAGQVMGAWKRTLKKDSVSVALSQFQPLGETEQAAVSLAAQKYAAFLGKSLSPLIYTKNR